MTGGLGRAPAVAAEPPSASTFEDAIGWVMKVFPGSRLVTLDAVARDEVPPAAVSGKQPSTADAPPP